MVLLLGHYLNNRQANQVAGTNLTSINDYFAFFALMLFFSFFFFFVSFFYRLYVLLP